jgi:hypothetical protein
VKGRGRALRGPRDAAESQEPEVAERVEPDDEASEDVRRLVRSIASCPHRVDWLRSIIARHLDRVGRNLSVCGYPDAARVVETYAAAYRRGEIELW